MKVTGTVTAVSKKAIEIDGTEFLISKFSKMDRLPPKGAKVEAEISSKGRYINSLTVLEMPKKPETSHRYRNERYQDTQEYIEQKDFRISRQNALTAAVNLFAIKQASGALTKKELKDLPSRILDVAEFFAHWTYYGKRPDAKQDPQANRFKALRIEVKNLINELGWSDEEYRSFLGEMFEGKQWSKGKPSTVDLTTEELEQFVKALRLQRDPMIE